MSKFNIGDMVEIISGSYEVLENNKSFWLEGAGLILDIEDDNYVIFIFSLQKTSAKNFATYEIGEKIIRMNIKLSDEQNCLRSIEI